jgi:hypothetical protein
LLAPGRSQKFGAFYVFSARLSSRTAPKNPAVRLGDQRSRLTPFLRIPASRPPEAPLPTARSLQVSPSVQLVKPRAKWCSTPRSPVTRKLTDPSYCQTDRHAFHLSPHRRNTGVNKEDVEAIHAAGPRSSKMTRSCSRQICRKTLQYPRVKNGRHRRSDTFASDGRSFLHPWRANDGDSGSCPLAWLSPMSTALRPGRRESSAQHGNRPASGLPLVLRLTQTEWNCFTAADRAQICRWPTTSV